ncbi:MAG: helix-turn-helix domain-containing protein [Anaerolineae bacterium]
MTEQRPAIDPNAIYSRQEAARLLGVSLSTLKKLINAGYLKVSRPPGMRRIFIKGESILAMLDATEVEHVS